MNKKINPDVLIIGGGVVGLISALELKKQGLSAVIIDDESMVKSSWAGAGIISPLYPWKYDDFTNQLSIKSQQNYSKLAQEIEENSGINPEYIESGLLMLDNFNTDSAKKWLKQWKISYQQKEDGLLFNVAQIRNPLLIKALKKYLEKLGIKFINTKIDKLNINNNKVTGADNINAKYTLICGGAKSSELIDIKVYPVKGQIITLYDKQQTIKHIYLKDNKYLVPRSDGLVLVGATQEKVGFDDSLDNKYKKQLFDFAIELFPHLKEQKIVNHWCGFRPGSDKIIIKKSEKYNNLFINTGHFTNGVNTAPESAKIITNLILEKNAN